MTELRGGRHFSGRRSWLYAGAALTALVLVLIVVLVVRAQGTGQERSADLTRSPTPSSTSTPAAKAESLASFDGTGDETTKPFKAASNWQIAWEAPPSSGFVVELLKDGASRGEIVTGKKKAKGSTFVSEEGEFKLKVTASGRWTITIVGRPATP